MTDIQSDLWEELRTAALLGTDRRPLPTAAGTPALVAAAGAVDRTDPAAALLELAALVTVRRRAGLLPGDAGPSATPADPDERPALPEAAARRLAVLLSGRAAGAGAGAGGPGALANLAELLPQWLSGARESGYRLPPALVPALLDAARARSELRADAVALAGPLGRWLAERNPDWSYVRRTVTENQGAGEERTWHEGLFAERVTHLTRLRRSDPAAGLELLRGTWSTERAEDRLLFLDALQEGLSQADEPFLEAALGDRSKNVRTTAAELLSTLPGSALGARMAERARSAVRLVDGRLLVSPPTACDAAMQRDGIAPKSPTGRGERAWWFGELVAATPLHCWTSGLGLTHTELLARPVTAEEGGEDDDSWRDDLREAWARAAVRQQDAAWARALLGPAPRRTGAARTVRTRPRARPPSCSPCCRRPNGPPGRPRSCRRTAWATPFSCSAPAPPRGRHRSAPRWSPPWSGRPPPGRTRGATAGCWA